LNKRSQRLAQNSRLRSTHSMMPTLLITSSPMRRSLRKKILRKRRPKLQPKERQVTQSNQAKTIMKPLFSIFVIRTLPFVLRSASSMMKISMSKSRNIRKALKSLSSEERVQRMQLPASKPRTKRRRRRPKPHLSRRKSRRA